MRMHQQRLAQREDFAHQIDQARHQPEQVGFGFHDRSGKGGGVKGFNARGRAGPVAQGLVGVFAQRLRGAEGRQESAQFTQLL